MHHCSVLISCALRKCPTCMSCGKLSIIELINLILMSKFTPLQLQNKNGVLLDRSVAQCSLIQTLDCQINTVVFQAPSLWTSLLSVSMCVTRWWLSYLTSVWSPNSLLGLSHCGRVCVYGVVTHPAWTRWSFFAVFLMKICEEKTPLSSLSGYANTFFWSVKTTVLAMTRNL